MKGPSGYLWFDTAERPRLIDLSEAARRWVRAADTKPLS